MEAILAAILAFCTALWGWPGWAVLILIVCMALDWITGSWAARRKGQWSSSAARDGLWHKLGEIVALLVAALCDIAIRVILKSAAAPLLLLLAATLPHTSLLIAWRFSRRAMQAAFGVPMLGMSLTGWLMAFIMGRQEGFSSMRAIRRLVGLMSAILCAGLILGIMVYPPSVVWSSFVASFTGLIGWCLQKGKE